MKEGQVTCIEILVAIILPPLGVFLRFGCEVFIFSSFSHSMYSLFDVEAIFLCNHYKYIR